jgi:hypothetical protein
MIKNYKFVYGTYEAEVVFLVDTERFTTEMAESNLKFFDWYYDADEDLIDEIIKKYAMKAIVASSIGGYMNNVYSIQQEFDNCEGFCKVDGSVGITLTSICAYEFNEDYLENDN